MTLRDRIRTWRLLMHPDRHVREATRERLRRAAEHRRHAELRAALALELRAQAVVAARAERDAARLMGVLPPGVMVVEGRSEAVRAARERAPDALLQPVWEALGRSAASRSEASVLKHRARVLAGAGITAETVNAEAVRGPVVAGATREVETGRAGGTFLASDGVVDGVVTRFVVTLDALDAVAHCQLHPASDVGYVVLGRPPGGHALAALTRVIRDASERLRGAGSEAGPAVLVACAPEDVRIAEAVRGLVARGVRVAVALPPQGETWAACVQQREARLVARARARSVGRSL